MTEYNVDEYNIEGDNRSYNFKIGLVDNKINLQLSELTSNKHGKHYEGEFTLDELRQINRIFHLTNTIYDAQDEFKKAVERQKIALSENESYVNIMFHMVLGTDRSPFVIALPRNESARIMKLEHINDMFKLERDNLFNKLELLKRNTNELILCTSELETQNDKLLLKTRNIEQKIPISIPTKPISIPSEINPQRSVKIPPEVLNQRVPDKKNQIETTTNFINSQSSLKPRTNMFNCGILKNIVEKENEILNITNRIQSYLQKDVYYNLIYNAREDGDKAKIFHQKCDDSGKTLIIIKDNFGNRFGGFTTQSWSGNCIKKYDKYAFLFSLNRNKIYNVLPENEAIGCYPAFGPIFLGCQIRVFDNFFANGGTTFVAGVFYNTDKDFELTNGNQKYKIKDLEVYEVK